MCKISCEVKAETLVTQVTPAAVRSRDAVGAVWIVCYGDSFWEQVVLLIRQDLFYSLNLCLRSFTPLSLLGMDSATAFTQTRAQQTYIATAVATATVALLVLKVKNVKAVNLYSTLSR